MTRQPAACGTPSGYKRHWRQGETACEACLKAAADYIAALRSGNPGLRERDRWWVRTRYAALERLAAENVKRFLELVEEERARRPQPRAGAS